MGEGGEIWIDEGLLVANMLVLVLQALEESVHYADEDGKTIIRCMGGVRYSIAYSIELPVSKSVPLNVKGSQSNQALCREPCKIFDCNFLEDSSSAACSRSSRVPGCVGRSGEVLFYVTMIG